MPHSRSGSVIACIVFTILVIGRVGAEEPREGEHTFIEHPNDQFRIPDSELPKVKRSAEAGDTDAALKLATYYGFFLDNTGKRNRDLELRFYKVAADNGSQSGIEMLIAIYSTSTDRFDLSKACEWRRKLKRLAAKQKVTIQPDAEWYYDLYSEYFVARRSTSSKDYKKLGLQFLECAASLGLEEAKRDLAKIYSDDPEVRGERKEVKPCICGELPPP